MSVDKVKISKESADKGLFADVLREGVTAIYDPIPLYDKSYERQGLQRGDFYRSNFFGLVRGVLCPHLFVRDKKLIESHEGVDHFFIQYQDFGEQTIENGSYNYKSPPGSFKIIDLSKPYYAKTGFHGVYVIAVPRIVMKKFFHDVDRLHRINIPFNFPRSPILKNAFIQAFEYAENSEATEVDRYLLDFMVLFSELLKPHINLNVRQVRLAFIQTIEAYIHNNIFSSTLTPDVICRVFNCSRATLYRLFQPMGGVKTVIRNKRLSGCLEELCANDHTRAKIIEIAYDWGFDNSVTFARAFKKKFSLNPTEVRDFYNERFEENEFTDHTYQNDDNTFITRVNAWFDDPIKTM